MNSRVWSIIELNILLAVYSMSGIFSKLAAREQFLSLRFCIYYICIIFLLGIYAIFWQKILKKLPLTTAFANKAVTIVWGIIWGCLFFKETVTVGQIIGAVIVIAGVVIFAKSDEKSEEK